MDEASISLRDLRVQTKTEKVSRARPRKGLVWDRACLSFPPGGGHRRISPGRGGCVDVLLAASEVILPPGEAPGFRV